MKVPAQARAQRKIYDIRQSATGPNGLRTVLVAAHHDGQR